METKRVIAGAALVLAVVATSAAPASAGHKPGNFVVKQTVVAPNPTTLVVSGVNESLGVATCSDLGEPNVDGDWIDLPTGSGGHAFTLVATSPTDDFDIYFYDGSCDFVGASFAAGDEVGIVPLGAEWAAVNLFLGGGLPLPEFTLTVTGVV